MEGLEPLGLDQRVEQIGEQREQQHAAENGHGRATEEEMGRMTMGLTMVEATSVGRRDSRWRGDWGGGYQDGIKAAATSEVTDCRGHGDRASWFGGLVGCG